MKKLVLVLFAVVAMANISFVNAQERVSILYNGKTTFFDDKVLENGDTISKIGTFSQNLFYGEFFFGRRNFFGLYGNYGFQSGLSGQSEFSKFNTWGVGMISTISFEPIWWKISAGYFEKNIIVEQFNSENLYVKDSIKIQGIEFASNILFSQDDSRIFPRIELWGNTKLSCRDNKMYLAGYSFGLDIQTYRFDIMPDYFISPMLGVEKIELLNISNLTYKLGLGLGSNFQPSPIAKLFVFVSYINKYYVYGNKLLKTPVFGVGCTIAPINIFRR